MEEENGTQKEEPSEQKKAVSHRHQQPTAFTLQSITPH
jgi:hypothetical protein